MIKQAIYVDYNNLKIRIEITDFFHHLTENLSKHFTTAFFIRLHKFKKAKFLKWGKMDKFF